MVNVSPAAPLSYESQESRSPSSSSPILKFKKSWRLSRSVLLAVAGLVIAVLTVAVISLAVTVSRRSNESISFASDALSLNPEVNRISDSPLGDFSKFAVASDNGECSAIGRSILLSGGNAVDAAIAVDLCIGVMTAQSAGIGGGFFMTIYNRTSRQCHIIDAREVAPAATNQTFFIGKPKQEVQRGWLSIAVPGEVHGLYTAHKLYGKLPWKRLVTPTANLCRHGHTVSFALAKAIQGHAEAILRDPGMKSVFFNSELNRTAVAGDRIKRIGLANLLDRLADSADPIHEFYQGQTAKDIVQEFEQNGGTITLWDMSNYTSLTDKPAATVKLRSGLVGCGPPPPSGAAVALAILNILDGYDFDSNSLKDSDSRINFYHKTIEAMKFAYAQRSLLGDSNFVSDSATLSNNITSPEWAQHIRSRISDESHDLSYYGGKFEAADDHGTAHVSTMDSEGNAVSMTSTINLVMGSELISNASGILWNDEMDDFSTPNLTNYFNIAPSPANFIEPGKRPMSSMSPLIFFNEETGDVRLVIGAAGGSHIISSSAYVALRNLWFNETVKEAIDAPRVHNQLLPYRTDYEKGLFPEHIVNRLKERNQIMEPMKPGESIVMAIERRPNGRIFANSDFRKLGGFTAGE